MTVVRVTLALTLLLTPVPVLAGTWTAPEGCEVFMTVQSKGCRVSQYYRCVADPHGDQWRADFDQEGVYFLSHIDGEGQWVESYDLNPTVRQTLDPNAQDPASFSELMASGMDTFAFGLSREDGGLSSVTGFDRLTGQTAVIDGITLSQTEFDYTEVDPMGNVLRRSRGNEYVHPEWRLFFSGPSEWDPGDGNFLPMDGSPMEFIFPGEPGFLKTQPIYDCDAVMSSLPDQGEAVLPVVAK
ncbi:hypothetical protein [Tabrizicola sp.]|uniref:hypothetical protein n=1 Tax=Tabrizicola sp. TaxID=2005166 RepID=UPI00286B844B|nr:hypothetical protein [Tabrizicola sp.]